MYRTVNTVEYKKAHHNTKGENIMQKGLFIVFEGGEGAGKTTLIQSMKQLFEEVGREVVVIREPGGTPFAEKVRELYLTTEGLSGEAAGLLMNASRVDNIKKIINPALEEGKVVISDRFSASSLVYQGLRKGEYEEVNRITKHIPMLTFFVDVPPEIGIQRIFDNNRETNRLDHMPMEQHQKIYEGFHQLANLKPEIYWDNIIDGTQTVEELEEYFKREIVPYLNEWMSLGMTTNEIKQQLRGHEALVLQ